MEDMPYTTCSKFRAIQVNNAPSIFRPHNLRSDTTATKDLMLGVLIFLTIQVNTCLRVLLKMG
jgi:CMP-N-acetylneuraminic acid synthetase